MKRLIRWLAVGGMMGGLAGSAAAQDYRFPGMPAPVPFPGSPAAPGAPRGPSVLLVRDMYPRPDELQAGAGPPETGQVQKEIGDGTDPCEKPSKTLFEWAVGKKGNDGPNGGEEEDIIATDRPDFTEASSTVGQGRVQLETGYTFVYDNEGGAKVYTHSYPEALLRIGLFAEWFELRLGWNYFTERTTDPTFAQTLWGSGDLYLGTKLFLTEQKGCLPESSFLVQTFLPLGHSAFSADTLLPGVNYLYGWDINDFLSAGASTQANRRRDAVGHSYVEFAQSLTIGYTLTDRLRAYTEGFALIPTGARDGVTGPEPYFNGGFTYLVTNNFQLDLRAGVGLNSHAADYFTGAGASIRY